MSQIDLTTASVDIESRIAAQNQRASQSSASQETSQNRQASGTGSFQAALLAANKGITLSGHAQTRLASRQIELTDSDLTKLSDALSKAASKGAKSSLVLLGRSDSSQIGLLVSIPNRTVITAVDTHALKENIFTNIDSAMLI